MRLLSITTAAIGLAAFSAGAASAQDLKTTNPSWTGPYVGAQVGYAWQPRDGDEKVVTSQGTPFGGGYCGGAPTSGSPTTGCSKDNNATSWRLHAGYDYQFGETSGPVIGAVVDFGKTYVYDNLTAFSPAGNVYKINSKLRDDGSIRARGGYALSTGTLLYGTGGLAYGRIRNSFSTSDAIDTFVTNKSSRNAWGYNYGGGIEQKVGPFSVGALYLFNVLNNDKYRVTATGGAFTTPGAASTDLSRGFSKFAYHTMVATVSYHF